MGSHSVFAETGCYLKKLLTEKLGPEMICKDSDVQLVTAGKRKEDYRIGIYLYDLKEDREVVFPEYTKNQRSQLEKSPRLYTLYYLIFANPVPDMSVETMHEYVGKITQVFNDNEIPNIHMTQTEVSLEEKSLLWQALDKSYQLGLYYQLGPIVLSSEIVLEVPLVQEKYISVKEYEAGAEK